MAVQQSHPLTPVPPVSWRFSPLPTHIFSLLPDACSSESSDIELEQKQGLQQIEEERKSRQQQQQYEEYCSFLEEQKHKFYLQQAQQYREQEDHANGHIEEQCHRNGCFQKCLNEYDQEQRCIQGDSVYKQNLSRCVQEQGKYNADGYNQVHDAYQLNGYLQEESHHDQEYQLTNDTQQCYVQQELQYQYAVHQSVENECQYPTGGGEECRQRLEQSYTTDKEVDVALGQTERLIGQQETEEGGRVFCIVGPNGSPRLSTYTSMSTSVGSSEGMRLELAGVTLDSSTDDLNGIATTCGYRDARQQRKDLSMDSGIQGSSCDLAADSSGSDLDDDSLNGSLEVTVPDCLDDKNVSTTMRIISGGATGDVEVHHGETLNLVEELYIMEDSKKELHPVPQEVVLEGCHAFKNQNLSIATEVVVDTTNLSIPDSLETPVHLPENLCRSNGEDKTFQRPPTNVSDTTTDNVCNGHRTSRNLSPVSDKSARDNSIKNLDSTTGTYVSYSTPSLDDVTLVEAMPKSRVRANMTKMVTGGCRAELDISHDDSNDTKEVPQSLHCQHFVVVAIDIGTTYSGYAFCFTRDPDSNIHMMRKWEGGDPGLNNQKTPTTLLLTPNGEFHSFGFTARDFFHDLDIQEAKKWLYFDKFKMALHHNQDLSRSTKLQAANGQSVSALTVFAHALHHLKNHALMELSDQTGSNVGVEDVRWVVTVPAIWKQPAKQFMREAAYKAGLCKPDQPEGLLIALEPEAASICCRKLRLNQLVLERPTEQTKLKLRRASSSTLSLPLEPTGNNLILEDSREGTRYMVVDCGGGTVDITVHELSERHGTLRELHKATGGPWGSMGVDYEFEHMLEDIFDAEFMAQFKLKRPAAYVELLLSFEARKRSASPHRDSSFNIFPPFSFIDYYRKLKGKEVEQAVKKYGRKDITWSTQGMLRLQPNVMLELFKPMMDKIIQHIQDVLESPRVNGIKFLFLVGGFAESQILQHEVRKTFSDKVNVIIPQGVSLTILRGAVLFGLNPGLVTIRRSKQTYGVGILKRFMHGVHPPEKLIEKDGVEWCVDVLDKFVVAEQSVEIGETVVRRYTPAIPFQKSIVINIYSADSADAQFITDLGVHRCGTLSLNIADIKENESSDSPREIHTRMVFGGTEVTASALDIATGHTVHAEMDFLTISNDTEV